MKKIKVESVNTSSIFQIAQFSSQADEVTAVISYAVYMYHLKYSCVCSLLEESFQCSVHTTHLHQSQSYQS